MSAAAIRVPADLAPAPSTASRSKRVPDGAKKGQTRKLFFQRLEQCGYAHEVRVSSAADFGDPTIRKRMMVIARCDGRPIVWPAPTHAPRAVAAARGLKDHVSAASFIDFSRPCPSIFLTKDEARSAGCKRPLEKATMRRIARGGFRYWFAKPDPFIVSMTHRGDDRVHAISDPLRTVTTANRGEFALVAPVLVPHFGEREGQEPRSRDVERPYPVVVPGGRTGDLAVAHLIKLSENSLGQDPREPLHTVMAGAPRHGVVAAFVEQANTDMVGHDAREPLSTIVQKGCTQRLVAAQLSHFRTSNTAGGNGDLETPLTVNVAGGNHHALLTAHLDAYYGAGSVGGDAGEPLRTATALARHSLVVAQLSAVADHGRRPQVLAFLREHFGQPTDADLADPLATAESRARFGIVLLPGAVLSFIVDIGMRMLDPARELARAMGWGADYDLETDANGKRVTKTVITKLVGNGVCKEWARAHVRANCADLPWWGDAERSAA